MNGSCKLSKICCVAFPRWQAAMMKKNHVLFKKDHGAMHA